MKNKILSTFLFSLFISIAFVFFAVTTISFTAPLFMARNFEKWGMSTFAYGCYDLAYKASEKADEQYIMFEKSVNHGYNKQVLYYSERLLGNADFEAFCIVTNASNFDKAEEYCTDNSVIGDQKIRLLLSVMNEENYIENQYVKALIKADKLDDAFEFAMIDVKEETAKTNLSYDVTFSLASVVNAGKKLSNKEVEDVRALYEKLTVYVDNLELDEFGKITNYKDMLVAQRLCEVASTLEVLYADLGIDPEVDIMKSAFNSYRGMIYG